MLHQPAYTDDYRYPIYQTVHYYTRSSNQ